MLPPPKKEIMAEQRAMESKKRIIQRDASRQRVAEEKEVAAKAKEDELMEMLQVKDSAEALAKQAIIKAIAILKERW
jgi:uncharacterized membrane protein YgaE (UPF0421/DUF939 family)